jgi:protein TonB
VAAQVVKGARNQLDRYKSLGLAVSDRNLPIEAVNDVNKMREMVEEVITQSKTLSSDKKQTDLVLPLLEEAIGARSSLARDDYDAKRWKEEIADTRESMMNSRSVVVAVDESAMQPDPNALASNNPPVVPQIPENNTAIIPVNDPAANTENKPQAETAKPKDTSTETAKTPPVSAPEKAKESAPETNKPVAQNQNTNSANRTPNVQQAPTRSRLVQNQNAQMPDTAPAAENAVKTDAPLSVGSLVDYATEKVSPTYPQAAKVMRMTGVVRVELVVDENGEASVENATGPAMLQRAAQDAVKRWKFKPFTRDGQPVKAKGYVNFNFNL